MQRTDWDERYAADDLPWDSGEPDSYLIELVERGKITPGRTLEVGCGTGTNAVWLASRGFEVLGVDISPRAVARAQAKAEAAGVRARFVALDFLAAQIDEPPFTFVFDRGVLHAFDDAADRAQFARQVGRVLATGGHWLCLAGSTEGAPRDHGPPRRSARELVEMVEPVLEILALESIDFDGSIKAWRLLSRAREIPAQPSTRLAG